VRCRYDRLGRRLGEFRRDEFGAEDFLVDSGQAPANDRLQDRHQAAAYLGQAVFDFWRDCIALAVHLPPKVYF